MDYKIRRICIVSIPFKRESVSKVESVWKRIFENYVFQFPSNGKAYPKVTHENVKNAPPTLCFNSLQTGKRIQSQTSKFSDGPLT